MQGDSLRSFATKGDDHDGSTERHFCAKCGAPVFSFSPLAPGGRRVGVAGVGPRLSPHLLDRRRIEASEAAREIGVLLGDVPGHPGRTARGHLRMLSAAAGVPAERADDVLEVVGLSGLAYRRKMSRNR